MEQKLREYRALRRRKELIENAKAKLDDTKLKIYKIANYLKPNFTKMEKEKKEEEVLLIDNEEPITKNQPPMKYKEDIDPEIDTSEMESFEEPENPESWQYFIIKWTIYSVIWLTLWIFFLKQGFGAVYFAISALIAICLNTSVRKKKPGEVSAYSVFNKNCESIDGTLKAEELQRQMLYGLGGIRMS